MTTPISGYSGTPLIKKSGIENDMRLLILNAPHQYFNRIGQNLTRQLCRKNEMPDLIHLFAATYPAFFQEMEQLRTVYRKNRVMEYLVKPASIPFVYDLQYIYLVKPLTSNSTAAGCTPNRRVELKLNYE